MEEKLALLSYRKKVIEEIKGDENVQRKIVSYKKMNMQNDNFFQYVKEYLEDKLDYNTVNEMKIIANINLQKRISQAEAGVYKKAPERKFFLGNTELKDMDQVYEQMDVDTVLKYSNVALKYQDQCIMQVYPDDNDLKARVLLPHHVDAIPNEKSPEKAEAYIISNFDNTDRDKIRREDGHDRTGFSQGDKYRDGINQEIADFDDSSTKERYYFWSKSFNFVTDGRGRVLDKETNEELPIQDFVSEDGSILLDENILSPLFEYQCLPFIDIATKKDFEYWVRSGDSLYDATIMYNNILTSEYQTVELQGHAQAFYKGDAEHMPENIRVGADKLIFLPINSENPVQAEFGFANPGSDLAGVREFRESYLAAFLSSRGLDTSVVSGKGSIDTASSGIEQMLKMVEKFEASQADFALYKKVEQQLFKIIACYMRSFFGNRTENGELVLSDLYQMSIADPNNVNVTIEYSKPELIQTEMDKLDIFEKELDLGVTSKMHYLMEEKGMTKAQAKKHLKEIEEFEDVGIETQSNQIGNIPEIQPEETIGEDSDPEAEGNIL